MTGSTQPHLETVRAMMVETLGDRLLPGVVDYVDLFADDGVLELPFGHRPQRLEGREAIRTFIDSLAGTVMLGPRTVTAVFDAGDTVVMEYRGPVHNIEQGVTSEQEYISVFQLRDGRITVFREYLDPTRIPAGAFGSS